MEGLDRSRSDHTPLLLNLGTSFLGGSQSLFKFELGWLTRPGFYEMVSNVWKGEKRGYNSLQRWQNKIRALRQYLRGWAKHSSGQNKKEKQHLTSLVNELDKKAEIMLLSAQEITLKYYINERLAHMLRKEELK